MNHDQEEPKPSGASPVIPASVHLGDDEFMAQLEAGSLPSSQFRHADHLRLAWICLHQAPFQSAMLRVKRVIRDYAKAIGANGLYHETITTAWVHLVASHSEASFAQFLEQNAARLRSNPLMQFYSEQLLSQETARHRWIQPDLRPLPAHH